MSHDLQIFERCRLSRCFSRAFLNARTLASSSQNSFCILDSGLVYHCALVGAVEPLADAMTCSDVDGIAYLVTIPPLRECPITRLADKWPSRRMDFLFMTLKQGFVHKPFVARGTKCMLALLEVVATRGSALTRTELILVMASLSISRASVTASASGVTGRTTGPSVVTDDLLARAHPSVALCMCCMTVRA